MKSIGYGFVAISSLLALTFAAVTTVFAQNTWTSAASLPEPRQGPAVSVVNGRLYAMGGAQSTTVLSSVEEYDPATGTWTSKAPMPTARWLLTSSVVDGKIYAIAGVATDVPGSGTKLNIVEVYDPATDTWTTRTPIPTVRGSLGSAVVNGKIYAIGGGTSDPFSAVSVVEEYDPATDAWSTKKSMISAKFAFAIGAVNGMIYVMGGRQGVLGGVASSLVMSYDPGNDRWRSLGLTLPTARGHLGAGTVNSIIYAIGGRDDSGNLSVVQAYDPSVNFWATKAPMPTARVDFGVGVIGGKIYVVGGGTRMFDPTSARDIVEVYDTGFATAVEGNPGIPASFELRQNYPNPFNPDTRITYDVSKQTKVVLKVMNLLGRKVRTLVDEEKRAGSHEVTWNGKDAYGRRVASGVYLYRFETEAFVETRKMVLLQ